MIMHYLMEDGVNPSLQSSPKFAEKQTQFQISKNTSFFLFGNWKFGCCLKSQVDVSCREFLESFPSLEVAGALERGKYCLKLVIYHNRIRQWSVIITLLEAYDIIQINNRSDSHIWNRNKGKEKTLAGFFIVLSFSTNINIGSFSSLSNLKRVGEYVASNSFSTHTSVIVPPFRWAANYIRWWSI